MNKYAAEVENIPEVHIQLVNSTKFCWDLGINFHIAYWPTTRFVFVYLRTIQSKAVVTRTLSSASAGDSPWLSAQIIFQLAGSRPTRPRRPLRALATLLGLLQIDPLDDLTASVPGPRTPLFAVLEQYCPCISSPPPLAVARRLSSFDGIFSPSAQWLVLYRLAVFYRDRRPIWPVSSTASGSGDTVGY